MIRAVEQIVLVLRHRRQLDLAVDIDVTGRAGAAAAAQREDLVDAAVAQHLHDRQSGRRLDLALFALARHDDKLGHQSTPSYAISDNRSRLWGCWPLKSSEEPALTLSADGLREALDALAGQEKAFAEAIERAGYPGPRIRPRGYETLLRTIIGQQVSVQSANAIWGRLEAAGGTDPARLVTLSDEELRAVGLSRQKASYARSLAEGVASGGLDLSALPEDDDEAIAQLVAIKGIGRWSAEIYLLFAEGRSDIWPAGDLAVQIECGQILGIAERPTERETRALAEAWRPHRGAAAIFAWHHYGARLRAKADKAPV